MTCDVSWSVTIDDEDIAGTELGELLGQVADLDELVAVERDPLVGRTMFTGHGAEPGPGFAALLAGVGRTWRPDRHAPARPAP